MLFKRIQCNVARSRREAFRTAQGQWSAVSGVEGFLGQTGGWDGASCERAVIIAVWRDAGCYGRFMQSDHDAIVERAGQVGTYESIRTDLYEIVSGIEGSAGTAKDAIRMAGCLRLARCNVRPGRQGHFEQVQRRIWNPGMAAAGGMLGGFFCRHRERAAEYLVCTMWRTVKDHRDYRHEIFPRLHGDAEVSLDVKQLVGLEVAVESGWRVLADDS